MRGHARPLLCDTDLEGIAKLARYVHRIARVAVLKPSNSRFRPLRGLASPSMRCRLRVMPFDQVAREHAIGQQGAGGQANGFSIGAALIQIEVHRLVGVALIGPTASPDSVSDGIDIVRASALPPGQRRAFVDVTGMSDDFGSADLTINVRNRAAQAPRDQTGQRRVRRLQRLALDQLRPFLAVRSIFVGNLTTAEDLTGEIALTMIQSGVVTGDSAVAAWFSSDYLSRFLRPTSRSATTRDSITNVAFAGLWKNAGDSERAQAWRVYVKAWVHGAELAGTRHQMAGSPAEDEGALADFRKYRRSLSYAIPRVDNEPDVSRELSVADAASVLRVSPRQLFRLVRKGVLIPMSSKPMLFAASVVASCALVRAHSAQQRDLKRAERERDIRSLQETRPTLKKESARRSVDRLRQRSQRRAK